MAATDMHGNKIICSFSHTDTNRHAEEPLEDLINEGELDMNDIIPSTNGFPLYEQQPKQHMHETGFHPITEHHGLKRLEGYYAKQQERLREYHPPH